MKHYLNDIHDNEYEYVEEFDDHFDLENFDEDYLNIEKLQEKHVMGRRRLRSARRSIEEYLELKRLERENRDLFDKNLFDQN